jgi:protein-S-isoprenylcysteine O-methyltransferase
MKYLASFSTGLKELKLVNYLGLVVCLGGEILRKWSMLTASKNFTHLVRENKAEGQYLVTNGPYSVCRHPGYAGWFWWSIGTQLVLINPVCFVGYYFAVLR